MRRSSRGLNPENQPDWMTRAQFSILEGLDDAEIIDMLSPAVIADNINYGQQHVINQLQDLEDRGLVEKVKPGRYRISMKGRMIMDGRLDPRELADTTGEPTDEPTTDDNQTRNVAGE